MTAQDIKNKILEEAKGRKGGNDFIVVNDTEKGGICGTDASMASIKSGGGVACILRREDIYYQRQFPEHQFPEQLWWSFVEDDPCMTNLDEVCEKIEKLWNN